MLTFFKHYDLIMLNIIIIIKRSESHGKKNDNEIHRFISLDKGKQ